MKLKKKLFITLLLSLISTGIVFSDEVAKGLGFVAPQVDGSSNVSNPEQGEIIYDVDSGDAGFKGYNGSSWVDLAAGTGTSVQIGYVKDVKTSGTGGGNSSANTVHTRDLNTTSGSFSSFGTLSSNQITLNAGTYHVEASCPGYQVDQHQCFLYNDDSSSYVLDGTSEYIESENAVSTNRSFISGVVTIGSSTTFEIRHWTSDSITNGLGTLVDVHASNPQAGEVYTIVKITKID